MRKPQRTLPAANDNEASTLSTAARPCPICGRPADLAARPFCSTRCADVDLHRWLGGTYAIPGVEGAVPPGDDANG